MDFVRPSELALHGNVAENWRRFKQRLMLYLEATEKATKPDKLKVAILLNFIGEEALEVFNTFHLKEDEAENFDLVINKFDDFCEPKKNVIFERFKFFSATQKDGESIDSFITELKGLSTSCEFESQKDSLIRDRIVYGIQDKALQERLLREPNLTLLKAIEMCKTDEINKQQIKIMQNNQNICQIRKYEKKHSPKQNQESEKEFKCQRCGKSHRAKNCPAWGKRCSKCKKMNHFAAFCKSSATRSLNDETEETVRSIHEAKVVHTLEWKKSIIVNGKEICFKLDSGAEVNVLPYTFTRQMKGLEIFQTNRKLTSYTGHEIKIKGIATLNCKTKNKTESLEFFIADGYYQPILGIEAIEKLSLIKKCDAVQTEQNNSAKEILNRHKNIFEGIGRLPIEHKIRLNENTTPVIAPSRKIPFSIREKVKAELERMEKLDIIEKVEEPSEWTHPIVVVQKPSGDVRICMDPRELNKYIQRERYILPTAETIFSELKGATVFSVFDASSAFWQVPLDKESTNLCTIATPFGRFRFKRLPYGLNSASEVFQRCINNILSGLQGTACYMDDILIYGSTMEEHNRNLETVLRRLEENNVKLNAKKQQIAVDKVNFLGHIISRDGIAIQASRAEAIQKLKRPENKTEVQRFLGMVTYLGKFIPNLSDKTAPLRKLISNKSEWKFRGEEIDCFEKLKDMVSNAPILTFFDPTKPITISSDASQYGIGTVLMQGGHAIEYASFSLNATQRKYAQIEKELLAIVFGCERFQYYIWGNDVIVETDHKPLLSIVKKPLEKLSPRLQRMVLRLMRFQISLKFTPGKNMFVADHLSRDPLKDEVDTSYLEGQTESVHMLLVTTDEKIKRLQKETHGDHTLIQLIEYAKNGWPKYKTMVCDEAKPYWQFQDEIHVSDGIVYKGNCIVVPSTLRKEILQVVHSSHQGIAASKEKARSAFYWPGMITQVENEVEKCRTCQEYSRKNPEESRIAHEIPEFPWEKIAVDFMEVSGTSSILVVDYHSKFVEIRKLSSKRETETIMQLKTIFRTHGIPRTLVSDNGPPFNSTGFKNFAQKYEFKHQTSSPKYPRSNGQVERTIQTIKGLIIKAVKSGRDPNLALMEFNNTPKYDLPSPTQMLMGRSVRTLSTYTRQQLKPLFDTTKNYQKLRDHQQKYAGSPKRILRPLEVGDNIMLQERHRKWVPATVTAKHETPRSYMVKTPSGSEYRRNRSHLRPRKFSVEDSAPTSQSPSIPGSQAGTAMDDNIQDHGRPTSENRRAYDPRENVAKKVMAAALQKIDLDPEQQLYTPKIVDIAAAVIESISYRQNFYLKNTVDRNDLEYTGIRRESPDTIQAHKERLKHLHTTLRKPNVPAVVAAWLWLVTAATAAPHSVQRRQAPLVYPRENRSLSHLPIFGDAVIFPTDEPQPLTENPPCNAVEFGSFCQEVPEYPEARHNLKNKKVVGEALRADEDAANRFKDDFHKLMTDEKYEQFQIYNADETGVYWKSLPDNSQVKNANSASGHKQSKDRLSVLLCANADASHKNVLAVVGKSKRPRAIKNIIDRLPVHYYSSHKAWFNQSIFSEWFFKRFINEVRNFQENKLRVAPDQPMDQGVIVAFKRLYKRRQLESCLVFSSDADQPNNSVGEQTFSNLKKYDIKKAIFNFGNSWDELKSSTIRNGWKILLEHKNNSDLETAGDALQLSEDESDEDEQEIRRLEQLFQRARIEVNQESINEWIDIDLDDPGHNVLSNDDIVEAVLSEKMEISSSDDSSSTSEDSLEPDVPRCEALKSLDVALKYLEKRTKPEMLAS
ncbi:K02A2.6-like [Cordylochernes scorpioides]|uniref:RNA-directed DNA polymerase n=1 Tax=Cordylochernes scorpioides TaxID=51811 RepID=A0ABY6LSY2_9ARAC|nr:K02A2.6-like [Cordylochernes scorpioides]